MFERSEFLTLPIFALHNWAPEGQWQRGRLFWVTFFGDAKKVTGCRATPDQRRLIKREIGSFQGPDKVTTIIFDVVQKANK